MKKNKKNSKCVRTVMGLRTAAWFDDYLELLREEGKKHEGQHVSPSQERELKREARKAWLLKYCKKKGIHLQLVHKPLQNFRTFDEAEEWAMERGGYCGGTRTIRGEKSWNIYVNPYYKKGQY